MFPVPWAAHFFLRFPVGTRQCLLAVPFFPVRAVSASFLYSLFSVYGDTRELGAQPPTA